MYLAKRIRSSSNISSHRKKTGCNYPADLSDIESGKVTDFREHHVL